MEDKSYIQTRYNRILKLYCDVFGKYYPFFNIIQPTIELSVKKKGGTNDKLTLKFTNSEFLENTDDFIYHFYILTGIIEAFRKKDVDRTVKYNIETIYVSDKKKNSFIELSVEVKKS